LPALLGTAVLLLFVWHSFYWDFVVDDAYISFRYISNLVEGHGLVYNPGERVEGYSNLLWMVLLLVPAWVGLDLPTTAVAVGFLVGAGTLWLVYDSGRVVLGLDRLAALTACAALTAMGAWTFWVAAGLESPLFALLLLALWRTYESAAGERWGPFALSTLAALLALTRPEGIVAMPAVAVALLVHRRVGLGRVVTGAVPFVVLVGGQILWRLSYYGQLVPNTYFAKVDSTWASTWRGVLYLWDYLRDEHVLYLLPLVLIGLWAAPRRNPMRSLALILVAYFGFVVYAGGDGLYKYRFAAHVAPLLALALAGGVARIASFTPRAAAATLGLATLSVLVLLPPTRSDDFFMGMPLDRMRAGEHRWGAVGTWIEHNSPPDTFIATNVAGRLPFLSRRRALDMLGLCDPVVARTPTDHAGTGYAGHERAAPGYVLESRPDLIYVSVLDALPFQAFAHSPSLVPFLSRTDLRGYTPMLEMPGFRRDYAPARVAVGEDAWANLLVLREGPLASTPRPGLVIEEWRE
jgi:hypothetical protein